MGTRSLTRVFDGNMQLVNLYRQYDGYPGCHGHELFEFLDGMKIVNGYSCSEGPNAANGAGCLAAQLVMHFKQSQAKIGASPRGVIGGFYLMPVDETDCGQDYEYHVTVGDDSALHIKVVSCGRTLFDGTLAEFGQFINSDE